MNRERTLKVVLVVVGLIFFGLVYPLMMFVRQEPALAMMLSLYVTLGIFLLLAANPCSRHPPSAPRLGAFPGPALPLTLSAITRQQPKLVTTYVGLWRGYCHRDP